MCTSGELAAFRVSWRGKPGLMLNSVDRLSRFARNTLLPLCRDHFCDPVHGGFHERLGADLIPVATGRKRLMVQARQLYVLSHAALLGDRSGAAAADQGYRFLLGTYRDHVHGGWHFAATPEGEVLDGSKDLYGHVFLLFALAWLHRAFSAPGAIELAAETMDTLHARMALPYGGFHASAAQEWTPSDGPLLQNPHMHLFEAVLALHEVSGDSRWMEEADALVRLFRDRLFHRATGTLREVFEVGWITHPQRGSIVEPGHQFEWVWLLDRYCRQGGPIDVTAEIGSLFSFARSHGFDEEHGGIHDQVDPDGTPLLRTRRIWPVAETLKAYVAMAGSGLATPAEADRMADHLLRNFVPDDRAGWHETLTREGVPTMTDLPGSTPYHVFLAAIEAEQLILDRVGSPTTN